MPAIVDTDITRGEPCLAVIPVVGNIHQQRQFGAEHRHNEVVKEVRIWDTTMPGDPRLISAIEPRPEAIIEGIEFSWEVRPHNVDLWMDKWMME